MKIRQKLSKIFNERAQFIAAFGVMGATAGTTVATVAAAFTILTGICPFTPCVAFAAAVMGAGALIGSVPGTIAGFRICKPETFPAKKAPTV